MHGFDSREHLLRKCQLNQKDGQRYNLLRLNSIHTDSGKINTSVVNNDDESFIQFPIPQLLELLIYLLGIYRRPLANRPPATNRNYWCPQPFQCQLLRLPFSYRFSEVCLSYRYKKGHCSFTFLIGKPHHVLPFHAHNIYYYCSAQYLKLFCSLLIKFQ